MVELDIWIEKVQCAKYLAEDELKGLCEYVGFISFFCQPLWGMIFDAALCGPSITQRFTGFISSSGQGNPSRRIQRPTS